MYVPFWVPFSEYSVHLHFSPVRNIETACVYMNKQFNRNIESKRVHLRITVVSWCQKIEPSTFDIKLNYLILSLMYHIFTDKKYILHVFFTSFAITKKNYDQNCNTASL